MQRLSLKKVALPALLLILLCSCNWSGEKLIGGNYYVQDWDLNHIDIYKKVDDSLITVIQQQIHGYEVKKGYLLIWRKRAISYECEGKRGLTIITDYTDEDQYWIIELKTQQESGPLNKAEFNDLLKKQGLSADDIPALYPHHPSDPEYIRRELSGYKSCQILND